MKVRDFCSSTVFKIAPLASLREAAILMRNHHVGTLVVAEDAKDGAARPLGILTDRDIVVAVIAVPGARPEGIRVSDVMSTRLALAREDDGISEAVRTMREFGVRRLPVVGADGMLRGMLSADDVLRVMAGEMGDIAAAFSTGAKREIIERRVLDVLARRSG